MRTEENRHWGLWHIPAVLSNQTNSNHMHHLRHNVQMYVFRHRCSTKTKPRRCLDNPGPLRGQTEPLLQTPSVLSWSRHQDVVSFITRATAPSDILSSQHGTWLFRGLGKSIFDPGRDNLQLLPYPKAQNKQKSSVSTKAVTYSAV